MPDEKTKTVHIKKTRAKFVLIPNAMFWDIRLTPLDCRVYGIVNSLSIGKSGCCTMSNSMIADYINSTRSSVSKSVSKLVKLGFVDREIIYGKNNKQPVGKKLSTVEDMLCVFPEGISVDALTINHNTEAPCGVDKASSVVLGKEYNNSLHNTSYNIDDLETIDTLDFID